METGLKTVLIQNAMFVAGVATLIQLYPFWKIGSGLPIVMGTSSGFIGTAKAMGALFGYGALMGASFIGGIFEMVLGYFIKPLRKLFPPVVTSLVIISIGLSLLPVGINYFGGGSGAADFGSPNHLMVGSFVILVILIAKQFKGFISNASILIGIVAGYLLAILLGMVDFTQVQQAAWFSLPVFMPVAFEFNLQAIIAMGIMFIATTVETIGDVSGVANGGLDREASDGELQGGVMADGLGSLLGSLFGVLPNTSFSQNVGLVAVTKVVNRFVIFTGAVFLILCGFCPEIECIVLCYAAIGLRRGSSHHVFHDPGQRYSVVDKKASDRTGWIDRCIGNRFRSRNRQCTNRACPNAAVGRQYLCPKRDHHDLCDRYCIESDPAQRERIIKIFITGAKGSGKSTLVQTIIQEQQLQVSGFLTLPLYENGNRIGFYFHSLIPVQQNDQRFSIQETTSNRTIAGIFDHLGVECLTNSQGNAYIIMDEIGYLEHDENSYLSSLTQTIDKNPNIIGVLRKCDIQYICQIRQRKDILLIDLDTISFMDAKAMINKQIEKERKK